MQTPCATSLGPSRRACCVEAALAIAQIDSARGRLTRATRPRAGCNGSLVDEHRDPSDLVLRAIREERVLGAASSGENWLVNGGRFTGEHYSLFAGRI